MKVLIIGAKRYSFINKDTGEHISGLNVHYLDPAYREDNNNTKGLLPIKITALDKVFDQLSEIPGIYEVDFRQRPGQGSKPVLTLVNAILIKPVEIEG